MPSAAVSASLMFCFAVCGCDKAVNDPLIYVYTHVLVEECDYILSSFRFSLLSIIL